MKYFSEHKDWIYHSVSAGFTFMAGAFVVLANDLMVYSGSVSSLKPEDLSLASLIGVLNVLARFFFIACVKTGYKKFQAKFGK